jgi:UDP-MurNAc hydroxylase
VETLRGFPKDVRVIIPEFPSRTFAESIRSLGFRNVVELKSWEPLDLGGGAKLQLVMDQSRHILDSALLLEVDGQVVVNQNDCFLDRGALERIARMRPALHFVQFSGASYYPAIYAYSPEQMKAHVEHYSKILMGRFLDAARGAGARYVIPSAGPPCFLDAKGFALNFDNSIFFDFDELSARTATSAPDVRQRLRFLYPGDVIAGDGAAWEFHPSPKPYTDKRAYLEEYRRVREPVRERYLADLRTQATPVTAEMMLAYFRDMFKYEDMVRDADILVQFQTIDGPSVWADFRERPARYLTACSDEANYCLTFERAWMSLIIQGKMTWYDLMMGHQVTMRRNPDRYAVFLMNHLYFRHDPELFELVRSANDAVVTVHDDEMEYVCQRFCPHLGRDLSSATVEHGVLTCNAHHWRFDLRDGGKCISGGRAALPVKESRARRVAQ